MTESENATRERIAVEPGEQVLLLTPSTGSPLRALPAAAFENLLVVSIRSPKRVERVVRECSGDPRTVGVVPVSGSESSYDGPLWTTDRVSPSDLTGISMRFSAGLEHVREDGWVVVDNLSTMLMYAPEERLHRFVDHLVKATRGSNARGVYAAVAEAVTPETRERFEEPCDRSIDWR